MKELVFCLEEESAQAMLEELLPRLLPLGDIVFRYITFQGKQDLEKQLPRKLRGYQNPLAKFVVVRDQDSHPDCKVVKARLVDICSQAGKPNAMVRIACRELESFYLADLAAVEQGLAIAGLAHLQAKMKYRSPDYLGSPSRELFMLTRGQYQKVGGSRAIGAYLDLDNSRSDSFRNLVAGIRKLAG
ncbi:MAG: DUF4276 family protein [Pseudomonadota bacterium]|uniref:DUF4276 family protein n=1 Tax=Polaromonas sp. TaxID=1869339 RepID=UPI0018420C54|nr:DUF4276 family protein [Polaromonas sp.]MBA3593864.1 DUF4276 family protein [Polaromonas sp.]MDQ3271400.1 DUF4276 family protein [Pseudomonadota bacterium]